MTIDQPQVAVAALPGFAFEDGQVADLRVGYWTMGTLAEDRRNVLVLCHGASGERDWALPFSREGGAFDPTRWFIISMDLIGGGASSRRKTDPLFPDRYTLRDLTHAVIAVLETLGFVQIGAFCGPSLASLIGLDLAAMGLVDRLVVWNGGVRADGFAAAGAEGICATITSGGPAAVDNAVRSFLPLAIGPIGLADSDRAERDRLAAMLSTSWNAAWLPDELVSRYACVATSDVAALHGGEDPLVTRLNGPILWLNSHGDMLFAPDDIARFAAKVARGSTAACDTKFGHISTNAPPFSPEFQFFDAETARFLGAAG